MSTVGGNAVSHEALGDVVVLATREQDPVGAGRPRARRARPAGSRRSPSPAAGSGRRSRGRACRSPSRARPSRPAPSSRSRQRVLEVVALLGRERRVVGTRVDALRPQERRHALACRRRSGSRRCRCPAAAGSCSASQASRSAWFASGIASRVSESRVSGPRRTVDVVAELLGHVLDDAVVGGGGRREDGHARVERPEDPADPPVVRPEVVAPVGDAVRLIDDEQPDRCPGCSAGRRSRSARWRAAPARSAGRRSRRAASPRATPSHSAELPELIVARAEPEALAPSRSGCASARAAG